MTMGNCDRLTKVISGAVLTILGSSVVFAAPGDLDLTFGGDGTVVTDINRNDLGEALTIQTDEKLVVCGGTQLFSLVRYNSDGSLDATFDGDGIVTTVFASGSGGCRALAVQPDGKLVAAGQVLDGSYDFVLVRYNADGSVDTGFGGDGIVTSAISAEHDSAYALVVQPDGKLVAAGSSGGRFTLVRYSSDGSLDTNFNGDGIVSTALPGSLVGYAAGAGLVVQSDGKLVAVGAAQDPGITGDGVIVLVRYNVDGSLDTSFDDDGIVITYFGSDRVQAHALIVQPDGKLVAAGYTDAGVGEAMALVRYNPDGSLDTSFDGDGKVLTDIGTVEDRADALVVQPDGKLVAAGITDSVVSIVRYNGDGSLDTSFGGDGIVTTDMGYAAKATGLAVQPDGKLVAAGWVSSGSFFNFFVARYESDTLDITPDNFVFSDESDVPLNSLSTSDLVSVSGLGTGVSVPVTVTGDGYSEYALNGNAYGTNPGWVINGDQISVRHTSAATHNTANDTMLTVGGLHASNNSTVILGPIASDTYTSTTVAADTTPDAFSFNDQTDVPQSTILESNSITVSGINTGTGVTISGGEYSLNGGSYTALAGTVNDGDAVKLRHTSSAVYSASIDTILIIGGVSGIFTSTTEPQPDITPDAFIFNDQTDVPLSTIVESNSITVSGINTGASISISGGEYSLNSGSYTALAGTADDGDTVKVRHLTSNSFSTNTDTTLIIGGVSDTFTTTALAADLAPDSFAFSDVTDVPPNILVESTPITVTGITAATSVAITNGEYSVNGGTYTALAGTVTNSDSIKVRHTSNAGFSSASETTLTIGGVSDTFTSVTQAADTTPEPLSLIDRADVEPNTWVESNSITVTGINAPAAVAVSNGEYSINGGAFTSSAGSVGNGDTIKVRHSASTSFMTTTDTTLTIGGVADTFTSTTQAADSGPIVSNVSGGGDGGGGGGGCTLTDSRAQDPTLPLLLLVSIGYLVRRYGKENGLAGGA